MMKTRKVQSQAKGICDVLADQLVFQTAANRSSGAAAAPGST
jgi:hypothetical protein